MIIMRGMHVNEIKRNIAGAALVGFFCVFYRGMVILFVRIMIMIFVGAMCESCNKKKNDGAPLGAFRLISHDSDVTRYLSSASLKY